MANGVALPVRPMETMMPLQQGGLLLGWELERDSPPGRARRGAELPTLGQIVDLDDCAVDLICEGMTGLQPLLAVPVDFLETVDQLDVRVDGETR